MSVKEQALQQAAIEAGMSPEEFRAAMEKTRDNFRRLQLCGRHDFQDATPERAANKVFECQVCHGTVSAEAAWWYLQGLQHAINVN